MHERLVGELSKHQVVGEGAGEGEGLVGDLDALVIPAFEVKERCGIIARSRTEVAALVATGMAEGFHVTQYPKGHSATDFNHWLQLGAAAEAYSVQHSNGFEPYVLVKRSSVLPRYDERFRGYGLNKVCHLVAMASAGYSFKVAPWAETLVVAREHEKSKAYKATYGPTCKDPLQALRVQALYNVALRELQPGQHPPAAWSPALSVNPPVGLPVTDALTLTSASPTALGPTAGSRTETKTSAGEEPLDKLTIVVAGETDTDGDVSLDTELLISWPIPKLLVVTLVLLATIALATRMPAVACRFAAEEAQKILGPNLPLIASDSGLSDTAVMAMPTSAKKTLLRSVVGV